MTVNAKRLRNVLILASLLLALGSVRPTAGQKPVRASKIAHEDLGSYPDCAKHPDFGVIVRSSVDRKYYFIQSCTVADSAEGEDFRHEVPNKPCDVPESNCR
jgi:hypothetical protein